MMRNRIIAILIVCLMLMPFQFAVYAQDGVEVTKIVFTDADQTTEITNLYEFYDGVSCSFTYSASGSGTAYGLLLLKRSGKIVDLLDQDFDLEDGSGVMSFDGILVPELVQPGRYTLSFYLFESKTSLNLIKGAFGEISGEVFPDDYIVTSSLGLDFESESSLNKVIYYRAAGTQDKASMGINYEHARHGNASLSLNIEKAWDRLMTSSSYNTGVMAQKERALGDGTYRVSGYVYPENEELTFSPRLLVRNSALNSDKDFNYTETITVPADKWTYFSVEYDVEGYFSQASTLNFGRPQLQVDKALKAPQTVYFDDIALTKIDLDAPEMMPEKDIVVKIESEDSVVVKASNSKGIIYALEVVEPDENGLAEAVLSLTNGHNINDTTVTVFADKEYSIKATDALDAYGIKYIDFRYFNSAPVNGVEVKNAVVNNEVLPYDEIYLTGGKLNLKTTVASEESKNLKMYAVIYADGVYKDAAVTEVIEVNGEEEFEASLDGVKSTDTVNFFLTDENNTLVSHVYTLDANGFSEKTIPNKAPSFKSAPKAEYNPVNLSATFSSEAENDSSALLFVRPKDVDELSGFAYVGVNEINSGNNLLDLKFDTEKFHQSGEFVVDYFTVSPEESGTTEPFGYISPTEIQSFYDTLNSPDVTKEDVEGVIKTTALKLDLSDFNSLNSRNASNALRLFIEYNENRDIDSALEIQEILDKSCATVMFCSGITAEAAERLGDTIMPDSDYFKEFKSESAEFKNKVANLIEKNGISSDKADIESAEKIFNDAFVTSKLLVNANTYGMFMEMITETYADKINLDTSSNSSLHQSDIFKHMFSNRNKASNIDGIKKLYNDAVSYLKTEGNKTTGGSGGSGGGSGRSSSSSSGGVIGFALDQPVEEVKPVRTLFLDMEDAHWALDSVMFLNSIGVISDAKQYRPDDSVLREEIIKMLICSFGELDDEATCDFIDADKNAWYYPYIASAFKEGFIKGMDENNFGVGNAVSRQDSAVMIYRIVKDKLDIPSDDYELQFVDTEDISDYALEAVKVLSYNGIINGYSDGSFKPKATISRSESAKIITSIFRR